MKPIESKQHVILCTSITRRRESVNSFSSSTKIITNILRLIYPLVVFLASQSNHIKRGIYSATPWNHLMACHNTYCKYQQLDEIAISELQGTIWMRQAIWDWWYPVSNQFKFNGKDFTLWIKKKSNHVTFYYMLLFCDFSE